MNVCWRACSEARAVAVAQVVGVVVAGRFAASRLVFAEDRKRTAEEFKCGLGARAWPGAQCLGTSSSYLLPKKLSLTYSSSSSFSDICSQNCGNAGCVWSRFLVCSMAGLLIMDMRFFGVSVKALSTRPLLEHQTV